MQWGQGNPGTGAARCVLGKTSPYNRLPARSSWTNILCIKSLETMQYESILQKQHCSLTGHAGENNNSDITHENIITCFIEIREEP